MCDILTYRWIKSCFIVIASAPRPNSELPGRVIFTETENGMVVAEALGEKKEVPAQLAWKFIFEDDRKFCDGWQQMAAGKCACTQCC